MVEDAMLSSQPFHVEAYPVLDLRAARKHVVLGCDVVLWRDTTDTLVGIARLAFASRGNCSVELQLRGPYLPTGIVKDELVCEIIPRDEGHVDVVTSCRSCKARARTIVYREGTWLCRNCQRLGYRSTFISPTVKDTERLAILDDLIGEGRSKHMRTRAYRALIEERKELVYRLGDRRVAAPPHLRHVLKPGWISLPSPLHGNAGPAGTSQGGPALPDVVEMVGATLFGGPQFAQQVERAIEQEIVPCYRRLAARSSRVSALQLRRAFTGVEIGEVPTLGAAATVVEDGHAGELEATMRIAFEGDPAFFVIGLSGPKVPRMPRAVVEGSHVVLRARYTPGNGLFAAALLQDEFNLIERCLDRQRATAAEVQAAVPAIVKRIVATRWPTLEAPSRP